MSCQLYALLERRFSQSQRNRTSCALADLLRWRRPPLRRGRPWLRGGKQCWGEGVSVAQQLASVPA